MRFVRYSEKDGEIHQGWILDDQVGAIDGDLFRGYRRLTARLPLEQVRLHPPVQPGKIICVARNYREHADEQGVEAPAAPLIFMKPPSSIIGDKQTILLPRQSSWVEHEAELAVIIGKRCRSISMGKAADYIFGYTCANDVTARDLQREDGQWTRAKGFDTFCPIGPWIETEFDPADALLTCRVNDEMRQMASTGEMIFSIGQLVAYITSIMTLEPGDMILTGTPAGVAPLLAGDKVEIEIEGIGSIGNTVGVYQP
ncbi:MAG: fumarylacetoacetate hydrolase family protein [Anaerolineae bacterium]|nr:fumarylacetoacetate hydrolase family protein [Anaerolineae bacterium]